MRRRSLTVKKTVVNDSRDQMLSRNLHLARRQRHIDGYCAPFELGSEDGNVVGAPRWPDILLTKHVVAMLEKSIMVAVTP